MFHISIVATAAFMAAAPWLELPGLLGAQFWARVAEPARLDLNKQRSYFNCTLVLDERSGLLIS